ncbi:MAG: SAM-dependent chlorinase/fluorinase [Salinivirgaceae bacterium]|nr:SAM-dependent chlorinase/fluorinase [Salinivirgaceae bacterium]MDD4747166.1 SAM-dependent chlorinase/fluorinase [Salinivirgaceae bacterium]MDY0281322.1 SAM-dependent chlorinase/fluorinase [Salinivirgaceae bacterium]
MKILTLTTDWNSHDYYVGIVKGYVISNSPETKIIEITHSIPIFDTRKACFTVISCYNHFPKNTIHVIGVRGFKNRDSAPPIAAKYNNHWFFGYENSAFLDMFDKKENVEIWALNVLETSFPEFELLIKPAIKLSNGELIESLGKKIDNQTFPTSISPQKSDSNLVGIVTYINSYGNAITNITKANFEACQQGRAFKITLIKRQNSINKICSSFNEEEGELVAIFNSLGLLELGQMNYRLDQSIGLDIESKIRIQFL